VKSFQEFASKLLQSPESSEVFYRNSLSSDLRSKELYQYSSPSESMELPLIFYVLSDYYSRLLDHMSESVSFVRHQSQIVTPWHTQTACLHPFTHSRYDCTFLGWEVSRVLRALYVCRKHIANSEQSSQYVCYNVSACFGELWQLSSRRINCQFHSSLVRPKPRGHNSHCPHSSISLSIQYAFMSTHKEI
jgi:hypothetical protein